METIILNRMYAGSYLEEHIGHEVINLFKADDGSNYIYVNEENVLSNSNNTMTKFCLSQSLDTYERAV